MHWLVIGRNDVIFRYRLFAASKVRSSTIMSSVSEIQQRKKAAVSIMHKRNFYLLIWHRDVEIGGSAT